MTINIRSEQDRILVKKLSKKSKKKKINVYFNKKNVKTGKSKYIQGKFYSEKNKDSFDYKSSYELAFLEQIERDDDICSYIYEPFDVYYTDIKGNRRIYKPDFMLLYIDSSLEVVEIKPTSMLKDFDVQSKARHCREYLKDNYEDASYRFVTEKDLFNSTKEYNDYVKSIKEFM